MAKNNPYAINFSNLGRVVLPDGSFSNVTQGEVHCNIRLNSTTQEYNQIFAIADKTDYQKFISFQIRLISGNFRVRLGVMRNANLIFVVGHTNILPNNDYYIRYKLEGSTFKIFVNGIQQNLTIESQVGNVNYLLNNNMGSNTFVNIGSFKRADEDHRYHFQGIIDNLSIWNTLLSDVYYNEIKNKYLRGTENGLVALYRMDEGSGTLIKDDISEINGTLVNGSWVIGQHDLWRDNKTLISSDDGEHYSYDNGSGIWTPRGVNPTQEDYEEYGMYDEDLQQITKADLLTLPNLTSGKPKVRTFKYS